MNDMNLNSNFVECDRIATATVSHSQRVRGNSIVHLLIRRILSRFFTDIQNKPSPTTADANSNSTRQMSSIFILLWYGLFPIRNRFHSNILI